MPTRKAVPKSAAKNRSRKKSAKEKGATKQGAKKAAKKGVPKSARSSSADARLRRTCLSLPEAHEVEAWGAPTFRVKNKVFAMYIPRDNHHHRGRPAVWICSTHAEQDLVVRARPDWYFKPPYVGPSGWIGAYLDGKPPWMEIDELIRDGYRQRAPKKLVNLLGD